MTADPRRYARVICLSGLPRRAVHHQDDRDPAPVARSRRLRYLGPSLLALVFSAAAGSLLAAAPPVGAHELGVAVVAPPRSEDGAGYPGQDGLRLAVDQSPDVSHPAGSDAGDHLGGIDVDLTVIRSRRGRVVAERVSRAVARGSRVVILLRGPKAGADGRLTADILSRVRRRNPLIVVAGDRATLPAEPVLPIVLLRDRRARVDRGRLARFEREFFARYRRAPDRAARTGYDAGRLLDRLLARLGEGPFLPPAVASAVPGADRALLAGTAELVPAQSQPDGSSALRRNAAKGPGTTMVMVVATAGAIAILIAGSLRRRTRGRRRPARL